MATANTNIEIGTHTTGVTDITFGSTNVNYVYFGQNATPIWQRASDPVWAYYTISQAPQSQSILVEYTNNTGSDKRLDSMALTYNLYSNNITPANFQYEGNYYWGVFTRSAYSATYPAGYRAAPLAGYVSTTTTTAGVSLTAVTVNGASTYTHTKTWLGGTGPTLTAGTTYYLGLGTRFTAKNVVYDSNAINSNLTAWSFWDYTYSATGGDSANCPFVSLGQGVNLQLGLT